MKEWLKIMVGDMRLELTEFLPVKLVNMIEPDDVIRMHHYKKGNTLLKEKYQIKDTEEYIDLMNWYEAQSKIEMR
tara:strand:- start:137 stop:361 length:225 start_codon:yes stop_codon:yes gene_type:complete